MEKVIDRLYIYFGSKKIKPTYFEKQTGISNGYFGTQHKRGADVGEKIIVKIIENCQDINPEWLLTGNGSMLRESIDNKKSVRQSIIGNNNKLAGGDIGEVLQNEINKLKKQLTEKDAIISNLIKQQEKLINKLTN
jgi:hypothetical protein